jgi:hypothetical protein
MHDVSRASNVNLADRIAALERELEELRRQQLAIVLEAIAATVGSSVAFSARELFDHRRVNPALAAALEQGGVSSPRRLGKLLQRCLVNHTAAAWRLEHIGDDWRGAIWILRVDRDTQVPPCRG